MAEDFTIDDFLGGKIKLKQLVSGYRATSDAVLLASAVRPKKGENVLDVGSGTGAVSLALAALAPQVNITGLEIQLDMLALAEENAHLNQMESRVSFVLGDVAKPPREIVDTSYKYVLTNPPYATECFVSPNKNKAIAHHEEAVSLADWIDFSLRRLSPLGTFAIIQRADRLDEILACTASRLGALKIVPLWPMQGKPAKRVIVTGVKNSAAPLSLMPGVVLHNQDGTSTQNAENILRKGECLWDNQEG